MKGNHISANNEVIIRRLTNGRYDIRDVDVEVSAESGVEDATNEKIATDVDGLDNAVEIANKYMEDNIVEYGLNIIIN